MLGLSQVSVAPGGSLVATGIGAYLFFIVLVRRVAPRRLASAPLFDFGCLIACGAVVGATALASQSSLTSLTLTLTTLVGMHQLLGLLSQYRTINALANRSPLLLVQDGVLLRDNVRKANLGEEDVRLAIRRSGFHLVSDVRYVVLERDGGLSVIGGQGTVDPWLLVDVRGQDSER